jgi:hypothetical protein
MWDVLARQFGKEERSTSTSSGRRGRADRDDNEDDPRDEVEALDLLAKHLEDCGLDFETVSKIIN